MIVVIRHNERIDSNKPKGLKMNMFKLKNKRTGNVTVIHTSKTSSTFAKEQAVKDHAKVLEKYNTKANWEIIDFTTDGRWNY